MHHFQFNPDYASKPSVSQVVYQAIGYGSVCWEHPDAAGIFLTDLASKAGKTAVAEIKNILHSELVQLLDSEGVAVEWNRAVEAALAIVESAP